MMYFLSDVIQAYQDAKALIDLFGASREKQKKMRKFFRNIGKAIMEEQGIESAERIRSLSPSKIILGEKSAEAFEAFQYWVFSGVYIH